MDSGIVIALADVVFVIIYMSFINFLLRIEAKIKEKNNV